MTGPRVLQVLPDTDATDAAAAALDLHAALGERGAEVRTVALGPGRRGGLDDLVPVLGPSPRSLAARTQLRRERTWADVVVLVGPASVGAGCSRVLRGGPPVVTALTPSAGAVTLPDRTRAVVVTVPGVPVAVPAPAPLPAPGPSAVAPGSPVTPGTPVRVEMPVAVDVRRPATSPAARTTARRELGLPVEGPVVRLVDDGCDRHRVGCWRDALAVAGAAVLDRAGRTRPPGDTVEAELIDAAADVVAWPGSATADLVPRALLAGASLGQLVVVGICPATRDLLPGATTHLDADAPAVPVELGDAADRARLGAAAATEVRRAHSLSVVADSWDRLLRSVVG